MYGPGVKEGALLWTPSEKLRKTSRIARYMARLKDRKAVVVNDYQTLQEWSVSHINGRRPGVPVKKILMGTPVYTAVNVDSMSNQGAIACFVRMAERVDQWSD